MINLGEHGLRFLILINEVNQQNQKSLHNNFKIFYIMF